MKQIVIPKIDAIVVDELWNNFKYADAIQSQAYAEGIPLDSTDWGAKFEQGLHMDDYLWMKYHTPCHFFTDTMIQAIKQNLTLEEYFKVVAAYGIEVE